jgi:hypothetical protein
MQNAVSFFIVFVLFLVGCGRSNVELVSPKDTTIPFGPVEFKWSSKIDGPSRLLVSTASDFSNPVLDTLVDAHHFTFEKGLAPATQHYWMVTIDDQRATASFKIENALEKYLGTEQVTGRYKLWDISGVYWDTTYQTEISLKAFTQYVHLEEPVFGIDQKLYFRGWGNPEEEINYFTINSSGHYGIYLHIDLETDSLHFYGMDGGLGNGDIWDFKWKKD